VVKKARGEKEAEARLRLQVKIIDLLSTVVVYGSKYGALALIFYWMTDALKAFAGQQTIADLAFKFLADIKMPQWLAYVFGVGGIGWAYAERKLRQRTVAHMASSKEEAEKRLDPGRTSSNLTARGTSRPEDKP